MEARITIPTKWNSPSSEVFCQSLPCRIEHRGNAKVSSYFNRCVEEETGEEKYFKGSFRGRPLQGKDVDVPDGYVGMILKRNVLAHSAMMPAQNGGDARKPRTSSMSSDSGDEAETKHYDAVGHFRTMRYWNWDKIPTEDDHFAQAMDWPSIASAIHKPVNLDEIQAGFKDHK